MLEMGVAHVFGPGTALPEIVAFLQRTEQGWSCLMPSSSDSAGRPAGPVAAAAATPPTATFARQFHSEKQASKDQGRVVAFTGSGGVGKSTLVGKLIEVARGQGQTVAVLACDPQSPLSGGALLGDRFRMPSRPEDDGVFIRSLATAGGQGGRGAAPRRHGPAAGGVWLRRHPPRDRRGRPGRHGCPRLADVVVLLLQPETGDDLQWEKAGLLEVADVIVVHKADLPGSSDVEAQVNAALQLGARDHRGRPGQRRTGEGLERLWQLISSFPAAPPLDRRVSDLLRLAQENLAARFATAEAAGDPRLKDLLAGWQERRLPEREAAAMLLELCARPIARPE